MGDEKARMRWHPGFSISISIVAICVKLSANVLQLASPFFALLRSEVAGEVEDEVGGVGGVGVDLAVVGGHDGHVRGDGSVGGIQS